MRGISEIYQFVCRKLRCVTFTLRGTFEKTLKGTFKGSGGESRIFGLPPFPSRVPPVEFPEIHNGWRLVC